MKKLLIIACAVVALASCKDKKSSGKMPLKTLKDSFAYAWGAYVGGTLHTTNIKDIDWDIFEAAFKEGMQKGDSGMLMDKELIGQVLDKYIVESKFGENRKKGEEYIAKQKGQGYTTTASGLLFKQTKPGNGVKPLITDTVMVHYTGKFVDGKIFDSNMGKDALKTSMNAGAIKGFLEALSMMEVGSEAEVIIPYQLAYGKEGNRNPYTGEMQMEPFQTLIFLITLDSIKK
jgi:FKBP-type peptidyl-prolyl cis-trans isomerase FklB